MDSDERRTVRVRRRKSKIGTPSTAAFMRLLPRPFCLILLWCILPLYRCSPSDPRRHTSRVDSEVSHISRDFWRVIDLAPSKASTLSRLIGVISSVQCHFSRRNSASLKLEVPTFLSKKHWSRLGGTRLLSSSMPSYRKTTSRPSRVVGASHFSDGLSARLSLPS